MRLQIHGLEHVIRTRNQRVSTNEPTNHASSSFLIVNPFTSAMYRMMDVPGVVMEDFRWISTSGATWREGRATHTVHTPVLTD